MMVRDWNEVRSDQDLGLVNFELKSLQEDGQQEGITSPIEFEGKARGLIQFDAVYFPVLTAKKVDGVEEPIPETRELPI
jgi:Ca2+-dependent lipid-binding protein